MLVHQAQVGMKVVFGRGNGEKTLGEIVKVNPTKAKVKILEARGNGRGSEVGSVWTVPYSLMTPSGVAFIDELNAMPPMPSIPDQPVVTTSHGDSCIMEAILDCYNRLSPEWLTCDGELPMNEVNRRRNSLNSRLSHLFKALGRPVSESAAYKWEDERKKEPV